MSTAISNGQENGKQLDCLHSNAIRHPKPTSIDFVYVSKRSMGNLSRRWSLLKSDRPFGSFFFRSSLDSVSIANRNRVLDRPLPAAVAPAESSRLDVVPLVA